MSSKSYCENRCVSILNYLANDIIADNKAHHPRRRYDYRPPPVGISTTLRIGDADCRAAAPSRRLP